MDRMSTNSSANFLSPFLKLVWGEIGLWKAKKPALGWGGADCREAMKGVDSDGFKNQLSSCAKLPFQYYVLWGWGAT